MNGGSPRIPPGPRAGSPRGATALAFVVVWLPYAIGSFVWRWVCDDAYIAFRYARNWATGNGLRFNLGDHTPVEGFSDFLWIAICAGLERFDLEMSVWPLVVSFACGTLWLALVFHAARHAFGLALPFASLATAFVALSPSALVWSTSGLETTPYALLLFATFYLLVLRPEGIPTIAAGVVALLLTLMREEGLYWLAVMAVLAAVSRAMSGQAWKRRLPGALAIAFVGYAIYWASRFAYFGHPFSNTALCKVGVTPETLERGATYVASHFLTIPSLFALPFAAVSTLRRAQLARGAPVIVMSLATLAYAVVVSGDFLPFGRLLVGSFAFHGLLFGSWLQSLAGDSAARRRVALALGGAVVLVGLLSFFDVHVVPASVRERFHFRGSDLKERRSEHEQWLRIQEGTESLTRRGRVLAVYAKPGDSMVTGAIGCVAYFSGIFVHDQNGLVTREVALRDVDGPLRQPGHDKHVDETFFLDLEPTFMATGIADPAGILSRFERWRDTPMARGYVGDFVALRELLPHENDEYLVVFRRLHEDESSDEAWATAFEAARGLME